MKNLIVAAALAVAAFCLPQSSFGQASPFDLVVITNVPATLASNVVYNATNIIQLTRNSCLSVGGRTFASSAGGNEVVSGSFSNDGTNFGMAPFTLTAPNSTTFPANTVSVWTNWSQPFLSGFTYVNFTLFTNTGAGTVTNLGWTIDRPTLNTATY